MILGIDFGYFSVKIIVLNKDKIITVGEKAISIDSTIFDPDKVEASHWIAAFQELCQELKINIKKMDTIITSISGNKVSIKPLSTLEVEESELMNILTFEAKKHIPLDGSDPVIDYHILGQNSKEIDKIDLLLIATTQKIIKEHNLIVKGANIKQSIFDTNPTALLNCYKYNYDSPDNDVDVIINIGCLSTTILVYGNNQEFFTREISIGGHHINLDIMKLKNIDYSEAETNKINEGMEALNMDEDSDDSSSIQISQVNVISELSDEIRKTLRYYMKSKIQVSYNKFYISGGLSKMSGLVDSLNSSLNVDFSTLDPFNKIEVSKDVDNISKYAIATGLALRGTLKD